METVEKGYASIGGGKRSIEVDEVNRGGEGGKSVMEGRFDGILEKNSNRTKKRRAKR